MSEKEYGALVYALSAWRVVLDRRHRLSTTRYVDLVQRHGRVVDAPRAIAGGV